MTRHRGPAPKDRALFAEDRLEALRAAVADLSWLLGRGYAGSSSVKLVGDRYDLTTRQRKAVSRCACADADRDARRARSRPVTAARDAVVHVDGLNALIVGESVLGGGVVLVGRDGAHRDLASVHGTYRRVAETGAVIDAMGALLRGAREVVWWLDRPVSNSGRLAVMLRERADENGWPWRAELVWDPDRALIAQGALGEATDEPLVASGDARILDADVSWIDLPGALVATRPDAWIVDLSDHSSAEGRSAGTKMRST